MSLLYFTLFETGKDDASLVCSVCIILLFGVDMLTVILRLAR